MAEQSIGFATGTGAAYGDGNVGAGYDTARMIAMETKTLTDGVLQVGNNFAMSGVGTATLTIQDGAAVVGGYFYENTSSSAINISTLANATYNVVIFVNSTSGPLTVSRSVAGTSVGTYSVRLAVATNAQLSGRVYVQLGTVQVAGAVIAASGIVPSYAMYGTTSQLPYQAYASMGGGIATLTSANTQYELSSFGTPVTSGEGLIVPDAVNNNMTVKRAGVYSISAYVTFTSGTTGSRRVSIYVNGTAVSASTSTAPGIANHFITQSAIHVLAANDVITISLLSSIASQSVSNGVFTVARI
jgi:hypothetical protein